MTYEEQREVIKNLEQRITELEAALETAAQRFAFLAIADDTMRNGVRPSVGAAEARAVLQKSKQS